MKVLVKNICITLAVCLGALKEFATSETSKEKCPYNMTVDLTDHTRFENGSYLYHGIIIPEEKVTEYDYRLAYLDTIETAEPHVRGCVCNNPKYCIKLCCELGEYFNEDTNQCEEIPSDLEMPVQMSIGSDEGDVFEVNIFDYFEYQVGLPCKNPESLSKDGDEWELVDDGALYLSSYEAYLDTVSYCLTPFRYNDSNEYVILPMSCPTKEIITWSMLLNTYAMAMSVIFLIPTVLVYLFLKELRDNMGGKLLICYLTSLIMGYSHMGIINISGIIFNFAMCSTLGFANYYFFMAAFLWLSVLCYDMWINFKEHSVETNARKNFIRFIYYSIYAWGTAAVLTAFTIWAQWSDKVPELYKPGIGTDVCWLNTNKWSAAIYFYFPNMIILVLNMVTFGHLTLRIYRVRRDLARMTQAQKCIQEKSLLILRLFLIMGISWIMEILSFCLRKYEQFEVLFILTDFCNAIQGVLIFVLFVFKRNVLSAIRKSISPERKPRRSVTSMSTRFSKLSTNTSAHTNSPQSDV